MITLIDGRLTQWDVGRKISIIPETIDVIHEVHFYHEGESEGYSVAAVPTDGGFVADIPNIILQEDRVIEAHTFVVTEGVLRTLETKIFKVFSRPKPPDYIYTETDLITAESLVNDALEAAKESGEFDGKDGKDGRDGVDGKDGDTPVRGTDYWTPTDIEEIKSYVDDAILGGKW